MSALQDRIDELEEENRQLREALCPSSDVVALMHLFGIRQHEAKILAVMLRHDVASNSAIDCALYGDRPGDWPDQNTHKVHVCRIRKAVPDWARPQNVWGIGYRLMPGARQRIREMIDAEGLRPAGEAASRVLADLEARRNA